MASTQSFVTILSDILVQHKIVTAGRARELQQAFGNSSLDEFDDFLLAEGLVEVDDLLQALSVYYKVPFYDVADQFFQTHLLHNFPLDFLVRNAIIPLEVENHTHLIMVASQPERPGLESEIRGFVDYDVIYFVGIRSDIIDAVRQYYDTALTEVDEDQDRNKEERETEALGRTLLTDTDEMKAENEAEAAGEGNPPGQGDSEGEG
jgi:hypothetical protein